ncbi:MAG: protein-L-isoaspartate(D-aspartate) O-methyltransferase [Flavobacteriales bacterium]
MMDTYKHKGLRQKLVKELHQLGIEDKKVLKAINNVPRHLFLNSAFENFAYQNKAFPIGEGQTISHPYTVAFQSQLLDVQKGEKVLEIGTGSGFQTAVLLEMGAEVYSIERHKKLHDTAKVLLKKLGYQPRYITFGDGYKGLPTFAPFDKIIVTAGAPFVPKDLIFQLRVGGGLLIPVGEKEQMMTLFLKTGEKSLEKMEFGDFKFVPMLKNKNK